MREPDEFEKHLLGRLEKDAIVIKRLAKSEPKNRREMRVRQVKGRILELRQVIGEYRLFKQEAASASGSVSEGTPIGPATAGLRGTPAKEAASEELERIAKECYFGDTNEDMPQEKREKNWKDTPILREMYLRRAENMIKAHSKYHDCGVELVRQMVEEGLEGKGNKNKAILLQMLLDYNCGNEIEIPNEGKK